MESNIDNKNLVNNKKKCALHPSKNIKVLCLQCKYIPCCIICISSKGGHHAHKTDPIESATNILSLVNSFKDDVFPKVIERIEKNEKILQESNDKFKEIKINYEKNNSLLKSEMKKIHISVSCIENDIEKQLETSFDSNTLINQTLDSSINHDNEKLLSIFNNQENNTNTHKTTDTLKNHTNDSLVSKYEDNDKKFVEKLNQFIMNNKNQECYDGGEDFKVDTGIIEIIKKYQESLIILNNQVHINNSKQLNEYNKQTVIFNENIINDIRNVLKLNHSIINSIGNFRINSNNNNNNNNNNYPKPRNHQHQSRP
ncbi:hypothetical protein ACTFIW_008208 [Dictyostelium discoideum]